MLPCTKFGLFIWFSRLSLVLVLVATAFSATKEGEKRLNEIIEFASGQPNRMVGFAAFEVARTMMEVADDQNSRELSMEFARLSYELAIAAAERARQDPQVIGPLSTNLTDYARDWAWVLYLHTPDGQLERERQQKTETAQIQADEAAALRKMQAFSKGASSMEIWSVYAAIHAERLRAERSGAAQKACDYAKRQIGLIDPTKPKPVFAGPAPEEPPTPPTKLESSTASSKNEPLASGTGFFITADGYIVTNFHVVDGASSIKVQTETGLVRATLIKSDPNNDLAILKVDSRSTPLPIGTSRDVKLGATVATVGFPNPTLQGIAPKLAKGEVASLSGISDDARYFQISLPVQPGNSGGALVDDHGNVVGVVSAKLSATAALEATGSLPENVNYAVKSSYVLGLLESLPQLAEKLKKPGTQEIKFQDEVQSIEQSTVLILVY